MPSTVWETFIHPHKAYALQYPAHWEYRVEDEGRSCGFGPRERDNVGLWISVLPYSIDTDRLAEDLPEMFQQVLREGKATNIRKHPDHSHHCMQADMAEADQGGHYWIIAGGDLLLFASSQVPPDERDVWNPDFERLIRSLKIMRDDELQMRKIAAEVIVRLRELSPDEDFQFDEQGRIRGRGQVISLDNLYRQVLETPRDRENLMRQFIEGFTAMPEQPLGREEWPDIRGKVLPVLKPLDYIRDDSPTKHLLTTEWLGDVVICYVIRGEKTFRFITGWDCNRWDISPEHLHEKALENLTSLSWPRKMEGSRQPGGGRLILVCPNDSFAASRLLHPDLHRLFGGPLGSPFLAGIPDRDTLVVFSNRLSLKRRLARQVRKDHDRSAYSITPRLFLVTADGIALAGKD